MINELVLQLAVGSVDKTQIHSEWDELRQQPLLPHDFDTKLPLTKNACEHHCARRATRKDPRTRGQNQHHKISRLIPKMRIVLY